METSIADSKLVSLKEQKKTKREHVPDEDILCQEGDSKEYGAQ